MEVSDAKKRLTKSKVEMNSKLTAVKSMFRGEPRSCEVNAILLEKKKTLAEVTKGENNVRSARVQDGFPPSRIRQYIKGMLQLLELLVYLDNFSVGVLRGNVGK